MVGILQVNEDDFGEFLKEKSIYNEIPILNTCPIDYFLSCNLALQFFIDRTVRNFYQQRKRRLNIIPI